MTYVRFFILIEVAIIASAIVSGVFLTFSDFVIRSLDGAKRSAGIEVMQGINRDVFRTVFMVLLLGMSMLSPFLVGYAYFNLGEPASSWIMAGGILYFAGVFFVTLAFNVPMNNRLDTLDHAGPEATAYWTGTYMPRWTFWNHVRAVTAGAAAVCFLTASVWLADGLNLAR